LPGLWHRGINPLASEEICVTTQMQVVLTSFEQLAENEKKELAAEIVRRSLNLDWGPLTDEELTSIADDLFVALDHEETGDGQPRAR
jgi:hypothetical protein